MENPISVKATRILGEDHQKIQDRYRSFREEPNLGRKAELADALLKELEIHSHLEERLVYPQLARLGFAEARVEHFGLEHGEVRRLISEYRLGREPGDLSMAGAALLARILITIQRHMVEEETLAFPVLEADPEGSETLGTAMAKLKQKLETFPPIQMRIDLAVPAGIAYDQWTQFEAFPCFLEHVKEVRQLEDSLVQWRVQVAGRDLQWTARIYEQVPDQRIAWSSVDGVANAGSVSFLPLTPGATRMLVEVAYEPQGLLENLGALAGLLPNRMAADLEAFKTFIEARHQASGAWRGSIEGTPVDPHLPRPDPRP